MPHAVRTPSPGPEGLPLRTRRFPGRLGPVHTGATALALAVTLALVAGCGDDDDAGDTSPPPEALAAADAVLGGWRLLESSLLAHGAAFEGRRRAGEESPALPADAPLPRHRLEPLHEFELECPDISINRNGSELTVFVVYGDAGCASDLTGEVHSGHVRLDVDLAAVPAITGTLAVNDYTTGDWRVDGTIGAVFADSSWILDASRVLVAGPGDSSAVTACLGVTWHNAGTRGAVDDDSWSVEGFASVEDAALLEAGPLTSIEVDPAEHLLIAAGCRWPTAGRLELRTGQDPPIRIDFGDGACDDLVDVTVLGRTVTLSLTSLAAPAEGTVVPGSLPSRP
jgi:hypothetical protein